MYSKRGYSRFCPIVVAFGLFVAEYSIKKKRYCFGHNNANQAVREGGVGYAGSSWVLEGIMPVLSRTGIVGAMKICLRQLCVECSTPRLRMEAYAEVMVVPPTFHSNISF